MVSGPASTGPEGTQIKAVSQIVRHPYSSKIRGFHHNDVTLVELTESFIFDDFVQPICIGDSEPAQGDFCIIAGWSEGQTEGTSSHLLWKFCYNQFFHRSEFLPIFGACTSSICGQGSL